MNTLSTQNSIYEVHVTATDGGSRLDRFLTGALSEFSRSRIKMLISRGFVKCENATILDANYRVKPDEIIMLQVPQVAEAIPEPQPITLSILYEDSDIIVVDKPPGLVVHPAPGNWDNTLVNALIAHCGASLSGIGGVRRPGIVHRLDKDTSGLIIIAKNDESHAFLAQQFSKHAIKRSYSAVVWGVPQTDVGTIETNMGRHPVHRKRMAVLDEPQGKHALTEYKIVSRYGLTASLLECRLRTGRTHQIRVHLAHLGHPLIGDSLYGRKSRHRKDASVAIQQSERGLGRQALHAKVIEFEHPKNAKKMVIESKIPNDINVLCHTLENR